MKHCFERIIHLVIAITTLLAAFSITGIAQEYYTVPDILPLNQGNEQNVITAIEKDSDGYLWIGTEKGLFRYSGNSYKSFYHKDTLSISSDYITAMRMDRNAKIWVGSDIGIHLIEKGIAIKNSILDIGCIYGIANMDEERLVISGKDGLYIYSKTNGEATLIVSDKHLAYSHDFVVILDRIFVVSDDCKTLYSLDMGMNIIGRISYNGSKINKISQYMGMIVVGTSDGLRMTDIDCNDVQLPERLKIFSDREVLFTIFDEYKSELVIGVKNVGIFRYYEPSGTLTRTWTEESLNGVSECMCVVLKDNLAICKDGEMFAISHHSPSETKKIQGLAKSEMVKTIFAADDANNALIFTDRGIYLMNLITENTRNITRRIIAEGEHLEKGYLDRDNNIWILDEEGKIHKYLFSRAGDIVQYTLGKKYDGDYTDGELFSLADGTVGVVNKQGISMFDNSGNIIFERIPEGISHYPYTSSDGTLYLYGKEGIFKTAENGPFTKIPFNIEAECMLVDNVGNIWAGTKDKGIYIYSPATGQIEHLTTKEGLPENSIRSILLHRNKVWISCRNSIAYVYLNNHNIVNLTGGAGTATNFIRNSGTSAEIIGLGNRIMFGSTHELTILNPLYEETRRDIFLAMESISSLDITIPANAVDFTLPPKHHDIKFSYSAVYFDSGERLSYDYMLEGRDNEWTHASSSQDAAFTNLKRGKYVFRVRVITPNGEFSPSEISVPFRVKKGFTESWLFIIPILLLLLLGSLSYLNRSFVINYFAKIIDDNNDKENLYRKIIEKMSERPSWLNDKIVDSFSLIYSPSKELEKEKGLSQEGRHQLNIITRNIDKIKDYFKTGVDVKSSAFSGGPLAVKEETIAESIHKVEEKLAGFFGEGTTIMTEQPVNDISGYLDDDKILRLLVTSVWNKMYANDATKNDVSIKAQVISASEASTLMSTGKDDYNGKYLNFIVSINNGQSSNNSLPWYQAEKYKRIYSSTQQNFIPSFEIIDSFTKLHKGIAVNNENGDLELFIPIDMEAYELEEMSLVPVDSAVEESGESAQSIMEGLFPKNCTVLIAENDKYLRDYIADTIRPKANIILATNGKDAMDLFEENDIDIAILDTSLPSIDGITVCSRIKNSSKDIPIPVILISSDRSIQANLKASDAGADAFLEKPFDNSLLLSRAAALLRNTDRIIQRATTTEGKAPITIQKSSKLSESDKAFLERLSSLIMENLSHEDFTATTLAEKMEISYSQFFSRTKEITGQSPKDLLMGQRMDKAMELLKEGRYNISEVAYMVGFSSLGSFSRAFKNKFGVTPSSV